jgi:hypothetical protein
MEFLFGGHNVILWLDFIVAMVRVRVIEEPPSDTTQVSVQDELPVDEAPLKVIKGVALVAPLIENVPPVDPVDVPSDHAYVRAVPLVRETVIPV